MGERMDTGNPTPLHSGKTRTSFLFSRSTLDKLSGTKAIPAPDLAICKLLELLTIIETMRHRCQRRAALHIFFRENDVEVFIIIAHI